MTRANPYYNVQVTDFVKRYFRTVALPGDFDVVLQEFGIDDVRTDTSNTAIRHGRRTTRRFHLPMKAPSVPNFKKEVDYEIWRQET